MTLAPYWMNQSLGAPLPADTRLYHKVGQLYQPWNTWNDAGIVVFNRDGQEYAYAIAYLGSYGPSWQDAYAHATSVSAATWRAFSTAPVTHHQTAANEQNLTALATASASGALPPQNIADLGLVHYDATRALDGNPATAWVEGAADAGSGEYLWLDFAQPVRVSQIGLITGLDGREAIFGANNRVREARFIFSDGRTWRATFADQRAMQYIAVDPVTTSSVIIVIDEVYHGSTYNDTAIAEVEIWGSR
jgi:hypothetical protein